MDDILEDDALWMEEVLVVNEEGRKTISLNKQLHDHLMKPWENAMFFKVIGIRLMY